MTVPQVPLGPLDLALSVREEFREANYKEAELRIRAAHALCLLGNAMHALKRGWIPQAERFIHDALLELSGK